MAEVFTVLVHRHYGHAVSIYREGWGHQLRVSALVRSGDWRPAPPPIPNHPGPFNEVRER